MSIAELRRSHNRRHIVAGEIATHLTAFESDLAQALASGSRLVGFLPAARTQADLSPVVGHDVLNHFVASLGLISQAMGAAVDGHNRLEAARQVFRVEVTAGGDKDPIPPLHGALAETPITPAAPIGG